MKILMVLTSHDRLGDSGEPTGFWLEELAAPYYRFKEAGAEVVLASPQGGRPPVDPKSLAEESLTDDARRFQDDDQAMALLADTVPLKSVKADDFDALFYPGGHGPLWDLAEDAYSQALIEDFFDAAKPVAAVCHGPAVFVKVVDGEGLPFLLGKKLTGFSNAEEAAVGLTEVVPFLLEDAIVEKGGSYEKGLDWQDFVVSDGHLITGQNPQSSSSTARAVLELL
ncbi:type 1 glutamine amidotransferase domain-containing protein [Gallaecimonas sp. GXIMD4217]|uniref:type 1 glutamine amidotransferase domain-containing protein n=1 Tax=Gallaecimonas sp. GXIMD4217 TaxID=3131927 RepID=UPI00311B2DBE